MVRRLLAVLTLGALWSLQSQALAFHVHAVPDRGHDDHHRHGPAIHHHDDFDRELHIDRGDELVGRVITVTVPIAGNSTPPLPDIELSDPLPAPELRVIGEARAIDVRSHGPPGAFQYVVRGPPTSSPL